MQKASRAVLKTPRGAPLFVVFRMELGILSVPWSEYKKHFVQLKNNAAVFNICVYISLHNWKKNVFFRDLNTKSGKKFYSEEMWDGLVIKNVKISQLFNQRNRKSWLHIFLFNLRWMKRRVSLWNGKGAWKMTATMSFPMWRFRCSCCRS